MRDALVEGNEISLTQALTVASLWSPTRESHRNGRVHISPRTDVESDALRLAHTEFLTWYVRGFARRLIDEGEEDCVVYRAAPAWEPRAECLAHEGRTFSVRAIYTGHRVRYWPPPGRPEAFSIPAGPECHHAIRRVA
jgi:hypothetical protein